MCCQQAGPVEQHPSDTARPMLAKAAETTNMLHLSATVCSNHSQQLSTLLVTGLPGNIAETELLSMFQQWGNVSDCCVIGDKASGQPKVGALISYTTQHEAHTAIAGFNAAQLAGAVEPLQVRYATEEDCTLAGRSWSLQQQQLPMQQQQQQQLHIQQASHSTQQGPSDHEQEQLQGPTEDNQQHGYNNACNDPTRQQQQQLQQHQARQDAVAAPIATEQLQQHEGQQPERFTLFFAKVLRSATAAEVQEVFSKFGDVLQLDLFVEYPGAPSSKGCGLVVFGCKEAASTSIEVLSNKYTWQGMRSPMVVKLITSQGRQQQQQQQQQQNEHSSQVVGSSESDCQAAHERAVLHSLAGHRSRQPASAAGGNAGAICREQRDVVPRGCAADAYKLFVGNIPMHCTGEELRQVLETVGPVVELVMLRDKVHHNSKSSAFVWYATGEDANKAIQQLNLRLVLPGAGLPATNRPLVVRRAHRPGPDGPTATAAGAVVAACSGMHMLRHQQCWQQQQQQQPLLAQQMQLAWTPGSTPAAVQQQHQHPSAAAAPGVSAEYPMALMQSGRNMAYGAGSSIEASRSASSASSAHSASWPSSSQQQQQVLVPSSSPGLDPVAAPAADVGPSRPAMMGPINMDRVFLEGLAARLRPQDRTAGGVQYQLLETSEPAAAVYVQPPQPDLAQCWMPAQQQQAPVSYVQAAPQQAQHMYVQQPGAGAPVYIMLQQQQMQQMQTWQVAQQQQQQQHWQQAAQTTQQQQQSVYGAALCYPPTSLSQLTAAASLQEDLQSLSLESECSGSSSLAGSLALRQQQSPASAGQLTAAVAMLAQAPSVPAALTAIPVSRGIAALSEPLGSAGLPVSAGSSFHGAAFLAGSPLVAASRSMSLQLVPQIPLGQCVAVLGPQMLNVAALTGADVKLLMGTSPTGAESLSVSITGSEAQVMAGYSYACRVLQQTGAAWLDQSSTGPVA